jgi:GNAT superfamily N-acetyltransferase
MIEIREAQEPDWPEISELGKDFYREAPELGEFEADVFSRNWIGWIESGMGVAFVMEIDGFIRGFIGGAITPEACCSRLQAQELAWFVHPMYRGHGLRLLRKLEVECFDRGCSTLAMIALSRLNAGRLDKLYRRLGYEPIETLYRKNLP